MEREHVLLKTSFELKVTLGAKPGAILLFTWVSNDDRIRLRDVLESSLYRTDYEGFTKASALLTSR